jgi:formylglycine-generating enzyme required for sulfatase activity
MIFVKGGQFNMGSYEGETDESFVRQITMRSFLMSKYEVTQAQWRAVMGNNFSHHKDCNNCPVENISWNDTHEFIEKLNIQTGKKYRLPTEAEWEYAARGGTNWRNNYLYSGSNETDVVAWYEGSYARTKYVTHSSRGKNT